MNNMNRYCSIKNVLYQVNLIVHDLCKSFRTIWHQMQFNMKMLSSQQADVTLLNEIKYSDWLKLVT